MAVEEVEKEDVVLEDNQLFCVLTGEAKTASNQEKNLQSVIRMLNEEYGFYLSDMERDVKIEFIDLDTGKAQKQKIELAVFLKGQTHTQDHIIRLAVVQDEKIKERDPKKGLSATLENVWVQPKIVSLGFGRMA